MGGRRQSGALNGARDTCGPAGAATLRRHRPTHSWGDASGTAEGEDGGREETMTDKPLEPPDHLGPEGPVQEDDPPTDPDEPEGGPVTDQPPQG